MKLEPIAKPIKIRIKIGKSEYSSLESVKKNISIEELYPLFKDGRLKRWLRQIGEENLADKVESIAAKCGEDCKNLQDSILFLSVFFEDISASLRGEDLGNDFSLHDYLLNIPIKVVSIIFRYTKGIYSIDWTGHIDDILSKSNYKFIFEDEFLSHIYSANEWGKKLSSLIEKEEDYRVFFDYIEDSISKFSGNKTVLRKYVDSTNKEYDWWRIYKGNNLDYVSRIYQYNLNIEWGKIFAELIQDWNIESPQIETILKKDGHNLQVFYEYCVQRGIKEAQIKLDSWSVLANSKYYYDVQKALNDWCDWSISFSKYNYNYSKMEKETELGKQILDFLEAITVYSSNTVGGVYSDNFLKDERDVLIEVRRRKNNKYSNIYRYKFLDESITKLQKMQARGVELARFALSDRVGVESSKHQSMIERKAVELIRNKLKKYKNE